MKALLVGVLFLALISSAYAISIDQIVKLSKLKAGDDLILQLIQKEKLDKPIFVGGIIPDDDAKQLLGEGVAAVFGPGSSIGEIAVKIRALVK